MLKPIDPLIRRFVTGSLFAAAFVWVAVRYFEVDVEVVWVLFVFSVAFVVGLVCLGLVGAVFVRLFRGRNGGMLESFENEVRTVERKEE